MSIFDKFFKTTKNSTNSIMSAGTTGKVTILICKTPSDKDYQIVDTLTGNRLGSSEDYMWQTLLGQCIDILAKKESLVNDAKSLKKLCLDYETKSATITDEKGETSYQILTKEVEI